MKEFKKVYNLIVFKEAMPFIIGAIVTMVLASFLGAQTPFYIKDLAETFSDKVEFYGILKVLGIIFIGTYLNRVVYEYCTLKFVQELVQSLRSQTYSKWLLAYEIEKGRISTKEKYPQGEVISRIITDGEAIRELLTSGTFNIFIDLIFVLSCFVSFFTIAPEIGLGLIVIEVVFSLILIYLTKYMRSIFMELRNSRGEMASDLSNVLFGIGQSYYTDHQNYSSKVTKISFDNFLKVQLKANIFDGFFYSLAESLFPIFLIGLILLLPLSDAVSVGLILVIVDLIQRSISPIKSISGKIANIQRAVTGLSRVYQFQTDLEKSPKSDLTLLDEKLEIDLDQIELKISKFTYPSATLRDEFSISNFSLNARSGEVIGIVGESGSGKSTLLNILSLNLIPEDFQYKIHFKDNTNLFLNSLDTSKLSEMRLNLGIISQESHIFTESLLFNLDLGLNDLDKFEKFWSWICSKVDYLNTWGVTPETVIFPNKLSLGQKQLISALRSCYLNKKIVLLDEVSSGMDGELELALRSVLNILQKKALTFVVTHRPETIMNATSILVMDHGNVSDVGTHHQLLGRCQIYKNYFNNLLSDENIDEK